MRPWMGAVAVAAAMLVAPGTALAGPEDPALIQFKLPSEAAHDDFEALGFNMDHAVESAGNGGVLVSAWVTDEEKALAEARGYPAVKTIHDKNNIDRIRAEIEADVAAQKAAKEALQSNAAGAKGKSAAPGTVRAQRADFYENNVGRYISIEANTTEAQITCSGPNGTNCSYTGPELTAAWYDAQNNLMGSGTLTTYIDTDVNPDYYQYHFQVFRIGTKGDGGPDPAYVRIAAPNGDVDTLNAKEWLAKDPPGYAQNFLRDFTTRYYNGAEAYQKMRDLAAEFSNISQVYTLPEKTTGYQRKAQTMLGYAAYATAPYVTYDANNLPVAGATPPSNNTTGQSPEGNTIVVLTSKEWGHLGGNNLTAQLVNPQARQRAAGRQRRRQQHHREPRHRGGRRDHQHRRAGRQRDQRQHRGLGARDREPVPPQPRQRCRLGGRALAAERPPAGARLGPARPDGPDDAPDRQAARRLEGRRVLLLPGARQRDRDLGRLPRDRGAARAQLRDRPGDHAARRQPRHLHRPADQRRRRHALAV